MSDQTTARLHNPIPPSGENQRPNQSGAFGAGRSFKKIRNGFENNRSR